MAQNGYSSSNDDDKKKSSGSSSTYKETTTNTSGKSAPPSAISAKDTTYISVNHGNRGVTRTTQKDFEDSVSRYNSAVRSGASRTQAWHTSAGQAMNQRGTYYPGAYRPTATRGSSRWNQQQQALMQQGQQNSFSPENATQRLASSKSTQYGLSGINGISKEGDIYGDGKWWNGKEPNDIDYAARIIAKEES